MSACQAARSATSKGSARGEASLRSALSFDALHELLHFLLLFLRKPARLVFLARFAVRCGGGIVRLGVVFAWLAENVAQKALFPDLLQVLLFFVGFVAVFAFAQRGDERFFVAALVVVVREGVVGNLVSLHLSCGVSEPTKSYDACSERPRERPCERIPPAARRFAL